MRGAAGALAPHGRPDRGVRNRLTTALGLAALAAATPVAGIEPACAILVILPLETGSAPDIAMRGLATPLAQRMGQPLTIENQPGAGGLIGADRMARAASDGCTLGAFDAGIMTVLPQVRAFLPFDPVASFVPVVTIATFPMVLLVHPSLPVKSVRELTALSKGRAGELRYASIGNGSVERFAMEFYKLAAGADLTQTLFRSTQQAAVALSDGQTELSFPALPDALASLKAGQVRALAVSSGERARLLPQVPTMLEAGVPGFRYASWAALYAPAATPRGIVERLNAAAANALRTPELRERFARNGFVAEGGSSDALAALQKADAAAAARIIRDAGVRAE